MYPTSIQISRRPVARGRSPAPSPIHAHANIWYGIHGPTPAVMSADANSVVQPRLKPKPGPSARPPENEQEEDQLDAGGARAERAQRRAEGREHAEQRERLGVEAALRHLREHDREHEQQQTRRRSAVPRRSRRASIPG